MDGKGLGGDQRLDDAVLDDAVFNDAGLNDAVSDSAEPLAESTSKPAAGKNLSQAFLRGRRTRRSAGPKRVDLGERHNSAGGIVPPGAAAVDNVVPFKRRRGPRVARTRRHPALRLLRPLAGAVALVGSPLALVLWLLWSPQLALAEVEVSGGPRVSADWVSRTLEPELGKSLLLLPLARAEERLVAHPCLRTVALRKRLPRTLVVKVEERRAVALVRQGRELAFLDREGQPIAPFDARLGSSDLPMVTRADPGVTNLRYALDMVEEIGRTRPDWGAGLSEVEVLGEEGCRVFTESLPFPLLVKTGDFENKARRLETLLPQIIERYGSVAALDLRFERRIILQPSARLRRDG